MPVFDASPALSLMSRPGDGSIRTRRVAIFVADGVDGAMARTIYASLLADGAVPRFVGQQLGQVKSAKGPALNVEISLEAGPSVLYDAVVIPDGDNAAAQWQQDGHALEFVKDQYRHCKPIMALGAGKNLLEKAEIAVELPNGDADPGIVSADRGGLEEAIASFKQALGGHRALERETDPPKI
jgi:catalase